MNEKNLSPGATELLTVEQFAKRLQVSRATVFAWMQKQILVQGKHFLKFGRVLRFTWSADLVVNLLHDSAQLVPVAAPVLERGTVPWRKCWRGGSGLPRNLVSMKEYRGVNTFLLSASPFSSPYWLTYKQAQDLGGHVRKGEKSSLVVFWKLLDKMSQEDSTIGDTYMSFVEMGLL